MRAFCIVITCALAAGVWHSQAAADERGIIAIIPKLKKLPAHIQPVSGELSLVADFQGVQNGMVPMFLINATDKARLVSWESGSIYCKRETKVVEDAWERCDSHEYSFCGVSYEKKELPAGGFYTWWQTLDSPGGKVRPVRFRLFQEGFRELVSNEGMGKTFSSDVTYCRYDEMGLPHAPFEDVAALATGKARDDEGVDAMGDAALALKRFRDEPRLFPVLKKLVNRLTTVRDHNEDGAERSAEIAYNTCLEILSGARGRAISPAECQAYVWAHACDARFRWSGKALEWLMEKGSPKEQLTLLVEHVLATPGHRALQTAIEHYADLVGEKAASQRLLQISRGKSYTPADRMLAQDAREELLPNPFLEVSTEGDYWDDKGRFAPITVIVTNRSSRTVVLPATRPASLLFARLDSDTGRLERAVPAESRPDAVPFHLKPGQQITLHQVRWWMGFNPKDMKPEDYYSYSLTAATPDLWDVPATCQLHTDFGERLVERFAR